MNSYKDMLRQIDELKQQAEEMRKNEIAEVIKDIKATMAEFGLTAADLGFAGATRGKHKEAKAPAAAKYRHPQTGETWTGKGRAPNWVGEWEKAGHNRQELLIG